MDYRSPVRHPVALAVVVMAIAITSNASIVVRGGGYPPFTDTKVVGPWFGLGPRLSPFATKPSTQTTAPVVGGGGDVHHVHRATVKQHVDNKKKQHQQHLSKLFKTTTTTLTTKTTLVVTSTTTVKSNNVKYVQRSTTPVPIPYDIALGRVQPTTTTTITTTTPKSETTTQDRSIITAPRMCPEGQRMSPDRTCVQILPPPMEFKDPDSYNN